MKRKRNEIGNATDAPMRRKGGGTMRDETVLSAQPISDILIQLKIECPRCGEVLFISKTRRTWLDEWIVRLAKTRAAYWARHHCRDLGK
jgi:hypothetical protein